MVMLVSLCMLLMVGCRAEPDDGFKGEPHEVSIGYLWSLTRWLSQPIVEDYIVAGRVVANDKMGEMTKAFVVDDGSAAIEIKVDSECVDQLFPLYSEVTVRCTGLSIGREGGKVVLGEHPTGEYVVDRIAESRIGLYVTMRATADAPPTPRERSIGELSWREVLGYVRISDVEFVEKGEKWCDTDTLSYVMRHITDRVDTLPVVVSPQVVYAEELIPEGVVDCSGIVDWADGARALRIINRQIDE